MTSLQMSAAKFSDLYPERRGAEESPGVLARATGAGHPRSMKTSCERNCVDNIKQMPMVKHMISALQSSGCDVDLTRNLQCDICAPGSGIEHAGGYDPALNQVSWLWSPSLIVTSSLQLQLTYELVSVFVLIPPTNLTFPTG